MSTSIEIYRLGSMGLSLTGALDELVTNGTITPLLALKVLNQYDKVTDTVGRSHGVLQPTASAIIATLVMHSNSCARIINGWKSGVKHKGGKFV